MIKLRSFCQTLSKDGKWNSFIWPIYLTSYLCAQNISVITAHTKTAEIFGISRSIDAKIMTTFKKERKIFLNQISGRKPKLSDTKPSDSYENCYKDHKSTASNITAKLNANHGGRYVMTWNGDVSWKFTGPMVSRHGRIHSEGYWRIFSNQSNPIVAELFPAWNVIFQDDNVTIYTA